MSGALFKTTPPGALNLDGTFRGSDPKELRLKALEQEERELLQHIELPAVYGWKWYPWARAFCDSKNKINLLCAANQISKSSTQIRRAIIHATDKSCWAEFYGVRVPTQFWYLYPTQKQVNAEFETKWKLFLPKGSMEKDLEFGWKREKVDGNVIAIHFNSGVHIYFKTYAQKADALQTGTCDEVFCDEELPFEYYSELMQRISASDGYFNMVFTATLGQNEWRLAMDPGEAETEFLPQGFKQTVSLYQAMHYEDGSPSLWTSEKIALVRARCSTHLEVLKRVYGKFIVLGGRKYEAFDIKRHMKPKHKVPANWLIYAGADIGSGGKKELGKRSKAGHPSAICFVAVRPDFRVGRVFLAWRGDEIETTAGDVVEKFIAMKKENKIVTVQQFYDWSSKDFHTISNRMGETFEKAEKGHDIGEDVINTLFKHDMMAIYEDEETQKLGSEMATLLRTTRKEEAEDDLTDAFRYSVTKIPWDWSVITSPGEVEHLENPLTDVQRQIAERRKAFEEDNDVEQQKIEDEFSEWNEAYGNE